MSSMTPCSFGSITLSTKTTCSLRKEIQLATCSAHKKFSRTSCSYGRCLWFRPISVMLLQNYSNYHRSEHISRLLPRATVDTDVTAEEHSAISSKPGDGDDSNEASGENLAILSELGDNSNEASPTTSAVDDDTSASTSPATATPVQGRTIQERKRKTPRVKDSDLVVGAAFTGTVRSIQPFGAFVDIGAYSNGLVHISNLSDEFVKDVASVVSVGQEVKVRITDVSREGGRIKISLTMRENAQKREYSSNVETKKPKSGNSRNKKPRNGEKKSRTSNQEKKVEGSPKLVIGEVLNGTVKKLNDSGAFISLPDGKEGFLPTTEVSNAGSVLGKTLLEVGLEVEVRVLNANQNQPTLTMKKDSIDNIYKSMDALSSKAFAVAFRQNKEIAAFLDEREKMMQQVQPAVSEEVRVTETLVPAEQTLEDASSESVSTGESLTAESGEKDSLTNSNSVEVSTSIETDKIDSRSTAPTSSESDKIDSHSTTPTPTPSGLESDLTVVGSASEANTISVAASNSDTLDEATSQITPVMKADDHQDTLPNPTSVGVATSSDIPDGLKHETSSAMHSDDQSISPKVTVPEDTVADEPTTLTSGTTVTSNPAISTVEDKIPEDNSTEAVITPALVKKLREETGAGMMDCKNALSESGGDIAKAQEFLRKKGLASAEKRAGKVTAEGRIGSYVHDSRIGVLIEVNCETDFVSRGDIFKELVEDLAMQVAACPQVQYLVPEDVPEEVVNKEREIEMQKEDLMSKPEQFRERIVDGRINKRLQELALLEQPYIKNDKLLVKDWVKQAIATVGENIRVKQFVRFNLGEGLQKRSEDFAAEVAAQTVQKASTNPPQAPVEQQAEAKEDKEKVAVVAVSAALVKQLRDETGAGMMDCKKALAESDGDLEKAQEYLRKKGVASAAKKSSRITAEGRISSYIHDTRIGALIEVNSETDFVARNERFKDLGKDLAMQVVACPQVQFVSVEDIPESVIANEREIEMQREDLQSKPENIREKIVDGRISKRLSELALLEQPFIKDDSLLVKDLVSQTVAALGENIKVRRFARFTLGK